MRLDVESSLSWHSTTFVWVRDQDIMALDVYKSLVDITLWDILCKVEEVPLYRIIGAGTDIVEAYNTYGR